MKMRYMIAALAATTMMSGAAVAFDDQGNNNRRNDRAASASTSTKGSAETSRQRGRASIETRGQARGTDYARSSSEGDVFSATTRDGSDADAFGRSEAEAVNQRQQQRQQRRNRRDD